GALASVGVAACGEDATETGSEPTAATDGAAGDDAAVTEPTDDAVTEGDLPERIVSLSPTATEMLFAIGAGEQVVAVDDQSNFPEDVPVTDLSGFEPNLEAIITYEPDLVVASGLPVDVVVLQYDAATVLDDTYEQIADLGIVTGHEDEAADLVAQMRADIDELVASVPERDEAPTYYHELDDTLFSATSATFIGELYTLAGLENVADAADPDGGLGGFPQLSAEFLVSADPDFIFLADTLCCGQDATTVAARPGFADLTAVRDGRVVELSDDIASRWGPRVVEFLATIVEATAEVPVG
ncbi:MAG: ABC transporter substrate-binding protein, partial [Acidimicrobiia bacterium]|nr:ABC transporter substrate-binding protein [Acidimicrobiia bacterium]